MTSFKYRGIDKDGNPVEGEIEEESSYRVVLALEEKGIRVSTVDESHPSRHLFPRKSRLTWSDLAQFNDQLLTITAGGLPLASSIAVMAHDIKNPRLRGTFEQVRKSLESGQSLEEALARHPKSFPPMYTTLIRAGERAGNLSEVFRHLSSYSKRMLELRNAVQEILTYPIVVIIAACLLVQFIMLKVVPVYAAIFKDFGGELPKPTQMLIGFSYFYRYHFTYILAGLCAAGILLAFLLPSLFRGDSGGFIRDWLKLRVPVVGRLYRNASVARFSRVLGMLLDARVPILDSVELAGAAAGNAVLARAVGQASRQVAGGAPLADALAQSGFFDSSFCWLLRNAEQQGDMPNALRVLEKDCERHIETLRTSVLLIAGPVVVVSVGIVIAYIIISLYLPIFSLGDVISGNSR